MKKIALVILVAVFVMAGLVVETDCHNGGGKEPPVEKRHFKGKVGM